MSKFPDQKSERREMLKRLILKLHNGETEVLKLYDVQ